MASLSNINGLFDVHSTGAILFSTSHGLNGQILRSNGDAAPTWVAASTVIGGPYLPLTGGTLTGATATDTGISLTVGGNLFVTGTSTLTGALSGSTAIFSGSGTILSLNRNAPGTSLIELKTANTIRGKLGATTTKSLIVYSDVTENAHVENNGNIGLYGSAINFLIGGPGGINFRESGTITIDSDNNQSSRNFQFKDGDGSSLMLIEDTGNVGIGTAAPLALLNIEGPNNQDGNDYAQLYIKGTGTYPDDIAGVVLDSVGSHQSHIRFSNNGSPKFQLRYNEGGNTIDKLMFYSFTQGNDMMTLDGATGNVGIGTTSPGGKLAIGPEDTTNELRFLVDNDGPGVLGVYNDGQAANYNQVDNGYVLQVGTRGGAGNFKSIEARGECILASTTGNVGIGTSSPVSKFEVSGSIKVTGITSNIGSAAGLSLSYDSGINYINTWASTPLITSTYNYQAFHISGSEIMRIHTDGNVGIGTTGPSEKLHVNGNIAINDRIIGNSKNYATSQGWLPGAAGTFSSQIGYYGGNFSINGAAAENSLIWGDSAFGNRALQWQTIGESGVNADGGWNKTINNLPDGNTHGYMSYVYVKRTSSATTGTFYYGCQQVLQLNGTVNGNPYFHIHGIGSLPQDVWCIAIGIIQAYTDTNTSTPAIVGIYRVDTGVKILGGTSFRSQSGVQTTQSHRTYHYYSSDPAATLAFANPGFYVVDGTEPSLSTLVN